MKMKTRSSRPSKKRKPRSKSGKARHRRSRIRNIIARKTWLTRIRREGAKQLTTTALPRDSMIKPLKIAKNLTLGTIKTLKPDLYIRSRILKKLDKLPL